MADGRLLTTAEAAASWGVSQRTIYRWMREGKVTVHRQGTRTMLEPNRPEERVSIVTASTDRHRLSVGSMSVSETALMVGQLTTARRSRFRWQVMSASLLGTVLLLGSAVLLGYGVYIGRGGELAAASTALVAERQRVIQAEDRITQAEQRTTAADRRATQARAEAQLTSKRLSEAMGRNIELAQAAADMLLDLDYAETVGW